MKLAAIRTQALSLDEVVSAVDRPEAGAIASFSGVVRNQADRHAVTLLEYEAYPSMAEKQMASILDALEAEIPEVRLAVLHRVGALHVGELAVVCAASAPHREEAFEACHRCIDRIKASVPIWKREHGPEGPYWVGWQDARCTHEANSQDATHTHAQHRSRSNGHHPLATVVGESARLEGLRVSVLTVSDSRNSTTDESGRIARELLSRAGASLDTNHLVRDEPAEISGWILQQVQSGAVHALVITGGTGIAERDRTIEAVEPLLSRTLDGFGEAFRRASFDEIGPRALLSRAKAGVIGSCLVFALPGSPRAVELAVSALIIPLLPHATEVIRGASLHRHLEHPREG
jgi:molybdopterin synthase catalytic subunit